MKYSFLNNRYFIPALLGVILSIVFLPVKALSDAPKDEELLYPEASVILEGDFGFPDTENEAVRQKYDSGFIKKMHPGIRRLKKDDRTSVEFLVGPWVISKNFDSTPKELFESIYSASGSYVLFMSKDYYLFNTMLGKGGLTTAFGFIRDDGFGVRSSEDISDAASEGVTLTTNSTTSFAFNVLPIEVGVFYRAKFHPKQYVSFLGKAAFGYYPFVESREDKNSGIYEHYGAGKVLALNGGVEVDLTSWNKRARQNLRTTYGIQDVYFDLQMKMIRDLQKKADISFQNNLILAGLMFEY